MDFGWFQNYLRWWWEWAEVHARFLHNPFTTTFTPHHHPPSPLAFPKCPNGHPGNANYILRTPLTHSLSCDRLFWLRIGFWMKVSIPSGFVRRVKTLSQLSPLLSPGFALCRTFESGFRTSLAHFGKLGNTCNLTTGRVFCGLVAGLHGWRLKCIWHLGTTVFT